MTVSATDFNKALEVGRPPNIVKLFPNSRGLLVSGKIIDNALMAKGKAMTMAANGRNNFIIRGALMAAQRANAAIIVEIARSPAAVENTVVRRKRGHVLLIDKRGHGESAPELAPKVNARDATLFNAMHGDVTAGALLFGRGSP